MDGQILPIVIGVLSSLLATFFFLILVKINDDLFLPWFRKQVYKGVDISGSWDAILDADSLHMTISLKQTADKVSGTFVQVDTSGQQTWTYDINGYCRDGYFFATVTPTLSDAIDYQTLLFKIYHKHSSLYFKGCISFADGTNGEVETHTNAEFKKAKS
ncbi:hypothetical protein [Vibrio sinaloensis]|uniref:SMODS-associating 2TM beta-strand rich effector domain-containing protein n=1 Tax=Photobacterium sp. (strain ATCC 43367) TaxID=379097 RepID=A0A0A5HVX6_PHOS4|nr:hypothetical protein [Vibrio sinaloensis]KGY08445.1 hypothetical protein NM06_11945 [Vibrio sinaloensis]HDY7978964.1 hypothetical protein [Vibrio vulnificus]